MAEYKDRNGIRCFEPDNTENEFYIDSTYSSISLNSLLEKVKEKWGIDIDLEEIKISAKYIHTHALGHDCYDRNDYTKYICVEYSPANKEKG